MDSKTIATNALKSICKHFLKDLEELPEDAFTKSFGGKTRTVADIVYEVNLVNDHVGLTLRKEELFAWPEGAWITAPEHIRTKKEVIDSFKKSSEKIMATAENMSAKDMEGTITTEDGETTPFERFRFVTLHMWYHGGQLNFIQTMLGDDAWHWQ